MLKERPVCFRLHTGKKSTPSVQVTVTVVSNGALQLVITIWTKSGETAEVRLIHS